MKYIAGKCKKKEILPTRKWIWHVITFLGVEFFHEHIVKELNFLKIFLRFFHIIISFQLTHFRIEDFYD